MLIGGLNKLTNFLQANDAIDLDTNAPIRPQYTCVTGRHYRLNDGRLVEVFEARVGYSPVYQDKCNRYELREVAA